MTLWKGISKGLADFNTNSRVIKTPMMATSVNPIKNKVPFPLGDGFAGYLIVMEARKKQEAKERQNQSGTSRRFPTT
jgi:hypothetical protein